MEKALKELKKIEEEGNLKIQKKEKQVAEKLEELRLGLQKRIDEENSEFQKRRSAELEKISNEISSKKIDIKDVKITKDKLDSAKKKAIQIMLS
jgi:hypothetical protein